ncbi:hypothetical protein N0V94_007004 [Neodidymelliopsis sp. IMI 364377]|nr:hypothetical protein N0V94_007004 [Neodidymelliopsis sp. IMI 364377]
MQVLAYSPAVWGVKADDQRGVEVDAKKVMTMVSVPIVVMLEDDVDVGIELAIEMLSIVGVGMSMLVAGHC